MLTEAAINKEKQENKLKKRRSQKKSDLSRERLSDHPFWPVVNWKTAERPPVKVQAVKDGNLRATAAIAHHNIGVELEILQQEEIALTHFVDAMKYATEVEDDPKVAIGLFQKSKAAHEALVHVVESKPVPSPSKRLQRPMSAKVNASFECSGGGNLSKREGIEKMRRPTSAKSAPGLRDATETRHIRYDNNNRKIVQAFNTCPTRGDSILRVNADGVVRSNEMSQKIQNMYVKSPKRRPRSAASRDAWSYQGRT